MIAEPRDRGDPRAAPTSLEDAGHALIDAANDAGGRDNITVVLFRLEEVERRARRAAEQDTMAGDAALHDRPTSQAALEARTAGGGVATSSAAREPDPPRRRAGSSPIAPPAAAPTRRAPRRGRAAQALVVARDRRLRRACRSRSARSSRCARSTSSAPTTTGFVTLYRGLPYELPLGLDLYQDELRLAGAPRPGARRPRRDAVLDQELRSQDDAYDLVAPARARRARR